MLFETCFKLPKIDAHTPTETVYLLQYSTWGHHSLGFYRDNELIEFTYGDWDLFALDKRELITAISHMVWPTLGALGRKAIKWSRDEAATPLFTDCINIVPFPVNAEKAEALFQMLSSEFQSSIADQVYHEADQVYFVPYHSSYALWNNCNHELAKWLMALDGQVSGRVFWNPDFIKGMLPRLPAIP